MRVHIISGLKDGVFVYAAGDMVSVNDVTAQMWIRNGWAIEAEEALRIHQEQQVQNIDLHIHSSKHLVSEVK